MVIGFKKRFEPPILDGSKILTIREDAKDRWKPGVMMHMATGTRSKHYNCFKQTPCISTQRIELSLKQKGNGGFELVVRVSGRLLDQDELVKKLPVFDGFKDLKAMTLYWIGDINALPNKCFKGKIIHWTNFRF